MLYISNKRSWIAEKKKEKKLPQFAKWLSICNKQNQKVQGKSDIDNYFLFRKSSPKWMRMNRDGMIERDVLELDEHLSKISYCCR